MPASTGNPSALPPGWTYVQPLFPEGEPISDPKSWDLEPATEAAIYRGIEVPVTDPGPLPSFEPEPPMSFEATFQQLAAECVDLLVQKQISYGPKNVEQLGIYGVFSRLASDKIERLRNMMNGRVEKGQIILDITESNLADESWEDTVKDIVNYGLILLALHRGEWGRPLARDIIFDDLDDLPF